MWSGIGPCQCLSCNVVSIASSRPLLQHVLLPPHYSYTCSTDQHVADLISYQLSLQPAMSLQEGKRAGVNDGGSESDSESERLLASVTLPSGRPPPYRRWKANLFLFCLTFFSALGGFLFGYDTGVVSGAMIKIQENFDLSPTFVELIVSMTIVGAALAALSGGPLSDLLGRRRALIIASAVFTLGAGLMGGAPDKWVLLIGRFVVGLGVGLAAMAVPMYIAESAPADMRGKLVVVNIMFVTGGQFIATLIDGAFSLLPLHVGWRLMLGLGGLPSSVMFIGLLFMPETPRWLVFHGKHSKAQNILNAMRRPEEAELEYDSIEEDYRQHLKEKLGFKDLVVHIFTSRTLLYALLVGCGLQLFQQFGGINTVMYYSASIIQMAGFSDQDAIWLATIPAFGNFVFTILGFLLVDRLGRRKLLIASKGGVVLCLALLGASFYLMDQETLSATPLHHSSCDLYSCGACTGNSGCGFCVDYDPSNKTYYNGTCTGGKKNIDGSSESFFTPDNKTCGLFYESSHNNTNLVSDPSDLYNSFYMNDSLKREWFFTSCPDNKFAPLTIVALFLYIACFAPGMGALPWTINSEIYPTWARSSAIAIATTVNWLCNLIVSMTFLTFTDAIGQAATFWMYSSVGVLGFIFIIFLVPETKGKKLEDVEQLFQRPWFMRWCRRHHDITQVTSS